MTDCTLPEIAMEAVHNDRRIRLLEHELSLLSDLAGRPKPNRRQIGAVAKRLIGGKTPRQLRPNDYLVAERKAARAATQAAARGDYAERSEEHTSELQSLMRISYAVFCLTKKKHA